MEKEKLRIKYGVFFFMLSIKPLMECDALVSAAVIKQAVMFTAIIDQPGKRMHNVHWRHPFSHLR